MTPIPTYSELASIYGLQATAEALDRYGAIAADFKTRYGAPPTRFSRAPGRVNLIGEHIDYEGYGVLPMAVARDTVVAIRVDGTTLDVSNHDDSGFPAYSFVPDPTQLVDTANHVWANYALAAYKGVHDYLSAHPAAATPVSASFPGLKLLVHGTVPQGSGLSSSSALVVAVATAVLAAYGCTVAQEDVAAFTCMCERYVGVNSGGMDQAISVMARPGEAAFITFNPVEAVAVPLPDAGVFVVANSLAVSNKAESAAGKYNLRVVECRLAAIIMAKSLGYPLTEARQLHNLQEVENIVRLYYMAPPTDPADASRDGRQSRKIALPEDVQLLDRCAEAAQAHLSAESYLPQQLQQEIGKPLEELFADFPGANASLQYAAEHGGFELQARAVHVFSEAARVLRFRNICNGSESDELKLVTLGGLMRKSHDSCREKYDCSCPELEEVVVCAKRAGALGSRLTGAGWGGCSVHLVRRNNVEKFMAQLRREFYARKLQKEDEAPGSEHELPLDDYLFATTPAHGAAIITDAAIISQ